MKFYNDEEINEELDAIEVAGKPNAFAGKKYPIEYLQHRNFEILLYFIFKKEIELGLHNKKYDTVRLMKGVTERGRDNLLIYRGENVGVIQCKRYGRAFTMPECAREIIKFLLHALQDKELITNKDNFTYILVSLEGFNEKALGLLGNFKIKLPGEPLLETWTNEIISENETIKFKSFEEVKEDLLSLINSISIEIMTGIDVDGKLKLLNDVIPIFFEVQKVVSESMLEEKFKQYLDFTTDKDLLDMRARIGKLPEDKKMRFGLFNIYGYDITFYQKLARDKELIMQLGKIKSDVDLKFIKHLKETVDKFQLIFISALPNISPFTKQAVPIYLFNKYAVQFQENSVGKFLSSFTKADSLIHQLQTMEQIKQHLLETGERVLNRDFSTFVGDAELFAFKKTLALKIYEGFNSVQEMSDRFNDDMIELWPTIETIEKKIGEIMPNNATIVIGDIDLKTEDKFIEMLKQVKKYE